MTSDSVLPREVIEWLFNLSLIYEDEPDLPGLKERLPAIYWDLNELLGGEYSVKGPSSRHYRLMKRDLSRKVLHQKLIYKKSVFSEIVVVRENDTSQLCYLQLVPVNAELIPLTNLPNALVFSFVYPVLIKMTLSALGSMAIKANEHKVIVTLQNKHLVALFQSEGFVKSKSGPAKNRRGVESTIKQYCLEKQLTIKEVDKSNHVPMEFGR